MKIKFFVPLLIILSVVLFLVIGCAKITTFLSGSNTNLTSTSLAQAQALRAMGITILGSREGSNYLITPDKISGKILSVVLPANGREDEGIVAFGTGRPDIAPAESALYDFDLSQSTRLHTDVVGFKPGYKGGPCTQIILLFGYFDVRFKQNNVEKIIRFCYGDATPYKRGDKLMYNPSGEATGKFYWYDTVSGTFESESSTRPTSPEINVLVKNFTDPVRPNLVYYMLGALLRNNKDYDGTTKSYISLDRKVIEDKDLSFTVDFDVTNSVVFTGITSEAEFIALTDKQLIQKIDMKQNVSAWKDTNLYCSISFEATDKFK